MSRAGATPEAARSTSWPMMLRALPAACGGYLLCPDSRRWKVGFATRGVARSPLSKPIMGRALSALPGLP
jgi:hypothetical protein